MEILASFDLTGSLRAAAELAGCSHHTVARVVAERDAWRARLAVRASSEIGPSSRFTWGGHGFTSGQSGAGSVVGSAVGDRESVGVAATPIARAGRGDWPSGPVQRMDRRRNSRGVVAESAISWAEETTGSGDREAIGVAAAARRIGRRHGRRRIQKYVALRHTGWAQRKSGPVKRCCGWGPTHSFSWVGISTTSQVDVRLGRSILRFRLAIREPRPLRNLAPKDGAGNLRAGRGGSGEVVVRSDFGPLICRTCRPCK